MQHKYKVYKALGFTIWYHQGRKANKAVYLERITADKYGRVKDYSYSINTGILANMCLNDCSDIQKSEFEKHKNKVQKIIETTKRDS